MLLHLDIRCSVKIPQCKLSKTSMFTIFVGKYDGENGMTSSTKELEASNTTSNLSSGYIIEKE